MFDKYVASFGRAAPPKNRSLMFFSNSSIPLYVVIDVFIIGWLYANFSTSAISIFVSKSSLFNITIVVFPSVSFNNSLSSSVNSSLLFNKNNTKSAFSKASLLRLTPICSTISSVSRIPAVSINLIGTPLMFTYSSRTSRVVPAISVTIALFSCSRLFNSELLPTLGRPIIAVFIPSLIIFPCFDVSNKLSKLFLILVDFSRIVFVVSISRSSYSG